MRGRSVPFLLLGAAACTTPVRHALPAPFPLTMGAVPVPAGGVGLSFELNDGLRGQEVERSEVLGAGFLQGGANSLSAGLHGYHEIRDQGEGGVVLRVKVALARPFAGRGVTALHVATAYTSRKDLGAQDESLTALDLALPVALRVDSGRGDKEFVAVYAGPRLVYEHYADHLQTSESMNAFVPGALFGVHVGLGPMHLFAEGTLAYVPGNTYRGAPYGGRLSLMPGIGAALQFGRRFRWIR